MSAPEWWVIALPALLVVAAIIAGLYANVKVLHDIKKTQLDIQKSILELEKLKLDMEKTGLETNKLRADLAERERRIVEPSAQEIAGYSSHFDSEVLHRLGTHRDRRRSLSRILVTVALILLALLILLPWFITLIRP